MIIREISQQLSINRNSVARLLDILTAKEEVEFTMYGRSKVFYLAQQVPLPDLMKFSSNFIITLDQDFRLVQANDAFLHYIKLPKSAVLHTRLMDIPTDLFLDPEIIPSAYTAMMGKENHREICIKKTDARDTWFKITITPTRFQDLSRGVILFLENLTEKKEIENALRESEEKYRRLTEYTYDILYSLNAEGNFTYIGPQVLRFGYKQEDFLSRPVFSLIIPEDRNAVIQNFRKHFSSGGKITNEFRVSDPHGRHIWIESSSISQRDETGAVTGIYGVLRDITERKRAEEALKESEEKYSRFFRTSRDCVFMTLKDGRLIDLNDASMELFGYSDLEELMRVNVRDLYANPEEREKHTSLIIDQGFSREFPVDMRRKDGSVIHTLITTVAMYDPDGNITGFQGTIRDITERKKAEEALKLSERRLSDLINFLPDPTFAIDKDGRVITWNKAMEEMTGIGAGDMLGKDNHEYAIPFYGKRRPVLIDLIFENLDTIESRYVNIQRSGNILIAESAVPGTYRGKGAYLWGIASPLYDNSGNIVGAIESIRDITDRKKAEEALSESEQKYRTLVESSFDGIVIHQNGLVVYANTAAIRLFGGTSEKRSIGVPVLDFVHPDYRAVVQERMKAAVTESKGILREKFVRRDGSVIDADVVSIPIVWNGEPAGYVIFRDVTSTVKAEMALRLSEQRLTDIISFLPDATFVIDRAGKVIAWNRAIEEMTGVPAENMLGKGDHEYSIPFYGERRPIMIDLVFDDTPETRNRYPFVTRNGDRFISELFIQNLRGGKGAYLWFITSPLYDIHGNITGAIESIRDITDKKPAEHALIQTNADLTAANEKCIVSENELRSKNESAR
ncbi:MAG: PAS domain S-box protein [Methanoregula sp.]